MQAGNSISSADPLFKRAHLSRFDAVVLAILAVLALAIFLSVTLLQPGGVLALRGARIAYLAPADSAPVNLWVVDPSDPGSAYALTNSPTGLLNFSVSPDGRRIAFTERSGEDGAADIKLLDLTTGALYQLTECPDSTCTRPVWSPDGSTIAYERVNFNRDVPGIGMGPSRIWLIELNTSPIINRPLFDDSQILGFSPQWSGDGRRIALFDVRSAGIRVYDFATGDSTVVPTHYGEVGVFSPDGAALLYPTTIQQGDRSYSRLRLLDLETGTSAPLLESGEAVDDVAAAWHPDGEQIVIARQMDEDAPGPQLFLGQLNAEHTVADLAPLLTDPDYANRFFAWDAAGARLVIQRFYDPREADTADASRSEIWVFDPDGRGIYRLADNGFYPRWIR
jgi:Tol biopolymer transport system component